MSMIRYQPIPLFNHFNNDINRYFGKTRSKAAAGQGLQRLRWETRIIRPVR